MAIGEESGNEASNNNGNAFYTALICENGHVITNQMEIDTRGEDKNCQLCGAKTMSQCHSCKNAPIRGRKKKLDTTSNPLQYIRPLHCYNCGVEYPWTTIYMELISKEIDRQNVFSDRDKEIWKECIYIIIKDLPSKIIAYETFVEYFLMINANRRIVISDLLLELNPNLPKIKLRLV